MCGGCWLRETHVVFGEVDLKKLFVFAALLGLGLPTVLWSQAGAISGRVTDQLTGEPVPSVRVGVFGTNFTTQTDADGRYRLRQIRPGRYRVIFRGIGLQPQDVEEVVVASGRTVILDRTMSREAVALPEIVADGGPDRLLDPTVTQTVQRVSADELRDLPITTIEDAIVLQAGVVGGSFRGGRLGQESFVIDGLNLKNQLDASTSSLGLNIPTFALEEANLITNAFSAQYGQALSGIVTIVTRDGGDDFEGHLAYENDRAFPNGWDSGLDRLTASFGGPLLGPVKYFVAADARARIDDAPVNAPAPTDPLDPRAESPWVLPHNSGEHFDVLGKLTIPVGVHTFRFMGVASENNNFLFERELKYTVGRGPAQSSQGRLGLFHWQAHSGTTNTTSLDFRVGYFNKQSIRGVLLGEPERDFGGFTFGGFEFAGENIARTQDSLSALGVIPGYDIPQYAPNSPWAVPAFFLSDATRGELARTEFTELKLQGDVVFGRGLDTDFRVGGQYVQQQVETFTRFQSYRAVEDTVPEPKMSDFDPFSVAGYVEVLQRVEELSLTAGVRVDGFNGRGGIESGQSTTKWAVSPRFALSTELGKATVVASFGRFAQAPDFQFLVDAAFDDTLRTGRSRMGNPNVGFETSWQYEFNVRMRPTPVTAVRIGAFVKQLDGLISSVPIGVDPDSSIFANADFGTVTGLEVTIEREFTGGIGARITGVIQKADASASSAFDSFRQPVFDPQGNRVDPAPEKIPLDFDRRLSLTGVLRANTSEGAPGFIRGFDFAFIGRFGTGLPFTRARAAGDTTSIFFPNGGRLPAQFTLDALVRRSVSVAGQEIGLYLDIRNLTNRRNVVAVRRDTGAPQAGGPIVAQAAADAFQAHPEAVPFESPRYNPAFDLNNDGLISGATELLPLFTRAAEDFLQPVFAFGPPRLAKIGAEIRF